MMGFLPSLVVDNLIQQQSLKENYNCADSKSSTQLATLQTVSKPSDLGC